MLVILPTFMSQEIKNLKNKVGIYATIRDKGSVAKLVISNHD